MVVRTFAARCSVFRSEAVVFRSIAQKRKSCFRFQPERCIEPLVMKDILESTMVSSSC